MTDYADNFTKVRCWWEGTIYSWQGWSIYWNDMKGEGELYTPDGLFVIAGDEFEELAREAVRHEEGAA